LWFVLTEMLEYKNVKFYDASAQEWVMDTEWSHRDGVR
jgi:3-mercaptopyruvate sulfurtransferase SseA